MDCAGFTHVFTADGPAHGYVDIAMISSLQDASSGYLHHDGSIRLQVDITDISLQQRQEDHGASVSNLGDAVPSPSTSSSAPSLARRAQRVISSALRIPQHIWQRQSLLPLPFLQAKAINPCPADAFINFYDPTIMQKGVVWESHNRTAYRNAALFHACLLHWQHQHFANLTDCTSFMKLTF